MGKNNRLIVAAAGSGKTKFLVKKTLESTKRILITTFTQANEEEIRRKFAKLNKCTPEHVTIQTWFSFLLQHGVRPYQGCKYDKEITGLVLMNEQSAKGVAEKDVERHYFTENQRIYSDKLAKFVVKCNEQSGGAVIDRLSRIYDEIFIDEVQDLAGYDLEFLKLLFNSKADILLVGDPRQGTYSTNNSSKNKKFNKSTILNFFEDSSIKVQTDDTSLTVNYRSCASICELSDKLYPGFKKTTSGNKCVTGHDGVFFVKVKDLKVYLSKYKPIQLRWDSRIPVDPEYNVLNYGISKGLEFERTLIYPTSQFLVWIKDNNVELAPISRSKFYVAITRAFYSIGIVCNEELTIDGIQNYVMD